MFDLHIACKPIKISEQELLDIFPEAKEIIPWKISEYQEEKTSLINRMRTFRNRVKEIVAAEKKGEFFFWFWGYAYLKYLYAPSVVQIDRHLYRLYRQRRIFNKANNGYSTAEKWEELKERAKQQSLVNIALPHLEKVRSTESRITALCPFHDEKTPSFTIYANQNTFHCYGCQAHGDIIAFKMKIHNLSFKDAVKELAL